MVVKAKKRKEKDVLIGKKKFEGVMSRLLQAKPKPMPKRSIKAAHD